MRTPVEGRRNFLKLMGASLALGGLAACTRQPTEHITPYIQQPEELVPGRPLFYATPTTLSGVSTGVLAESHEGRPTKIEGNPEHPGSLGACDPYSQASVLQLYDPDRSRALTFQGEVATWGGFYSNLRGLLADQQTKKGAGIRILTETVTFAQHGRSAEYHQDALSAIEVASVGTRRGAQRPRRRHAGIRLARRHALQFPERERSGVAR